VPGGLRLPSKGGLRPTSGAPGLGQNGGPPLDDEPPGKLLFVRHCWTKAREAAWRPPSRDIALFRLRRAEAAGLSYEEYMLTLLDSGRYPQPQPDESSD